MSTTQPHDMTATALSDRWDDGVARTMSPEELLRYRSNLLGSDLAVTNFAGGNTSAKLTMPDPLTGKDVRVLWVKGSGGDLGSMDLAGFATLYQDRVTGLETRYRGREHEDEMVGLYPHCTFNCNPRAASIDTPLHAFVPFDHVDHMHPDSVIAIAAAADGPQLVEKIFGGELGWIDWQRPGFDLGLAIGAAARAHPEWRGLVLGGHGLMSWGATLYECYRNTLALIRQAQAYLDEHGKPEPFGGRVLEPLASDERCAYVAALAPALRGALSPLQHKVGHFDDSPAVLELVCAAEGERLARLGTSCPDHFLRTKIWPLWLDIDPRQDAPAAVAAGLAERMEDYCERYRQYHERNRDEHSAPIRDPYPVVVLIPGVGMLTFAKDKQTARVSAEFYINAIHVMRGAESVSAYVALPEKEAFGIEYWQLEEDKLRRQPPPRELAGRVALVSGGAGGVGVATARELLARGAAVVLSDLDVDRLEHARAELAVEFGADGVRGVVADVTEEESVVGSLAAAVRAYGGIDILVLSAGLASAAPFEDTTTELWDRNMDVLARGYFLVAREAYKVMLSQGLGGSIVFVASKNALAASPQASAYCAAKAAEVHLARTLALEGAPHGVRVNVVNPDAVLQGSNIWRGSWRDERAAAYGIAPEELEEHYRKRSLLGRAVLPADVAEAIVFFASPRSDKSTGNILNVDAGNAASFTR